MKKYLLTFTALMTVSTAYALDCSISARPSCSDLGYTKSAADCEGVDTLKCPFGDTFFCIDDSVECSIGSILYDNLKCYDEVPSGRAAIAVVFDTTNKLALSLQTTDTSTLGGCSVTTDISAVPNFAINATAAEGESAHNYYTTSATSGGVSDTLAIINSQSLGGITPFASTCYSSTYGNQASHSWFVPTLGDLVHISSNYDKLTAAGITFQTGYYWSSTEYTDATKLWVFYFNSDSSTTTGPTQAGKASAPYYVRCAIRY